MSIFDNAKPVCGPVTLVQPKGGMCAACKHKHEDCSDLPFATMPKLKNDGDVLIVRCTWFESDKERKQ